jgi:hypothetical protein
VPKTKPAPLTQNDPIGILRYRARRIAWGDSYLADECFSAAQIAFMIEKQSLRIATRRMYSVCRREAKYRTRHLPASGDPSTEHAYSSATTGRTPWNELAETDFRRFVESIAPARLRIAVEKTIGVRAGPLTPAERQAFRSHRHHVYQMWDRFSGTESSPHGIPTRSAV